mgnify:CR=1 FL=1
MPGRNGPVSCFEAEEAQVVYVSLTFASPCTSRRGNTFVSWLYNVIIYELVVLPSNCTGHHDGKAKLGKSRLPIPLQLEYLCFECFKYLGPLNTFASNTFGFEYLCFEYLGLKYPLPLCETVIILAKFKGVAHARWYLVSKLIRLADLHSQISKWAPKLQSACCSGAIVRPACWQWQAKWGVFGAPITAAKCNCGVEVTR